MWHPSLVISALLCACATAAAVDLNQASVAELDGIKGIGPAVSSRILDERQKGLFKNWNDFIARVKGIGDGNAARFSSEGLVIDGVGYNIGGMASARQAAPTDPVSGGLKK